MGQSAPRPAIKSHADYGLATYELILLQEYFNTSAAIDLTRFRTLYAVINPDSSGPYFEHAAAQAFMETDQNKDGYITFDELIQAYLKSKKVREDLERIKKSTRKRRLFPY